MSKAEEFINQEETIRALTKAKAEDLQSQPNGAEMELEAFSGKKRKNTKSPKTYEKKMNHSENKESIPRSKMDSSEYHSFSSTHGSQKRS
jgi:hypothetical protein